MPNETETTTTGSRVKESSITKAVRIVKVDIEKRIVYGPVLEPTTPTTADADGHFYSADEIEKAAHKFMKKLHVGEAAADGVYHIQRAGLDKVHLVESWIVPEDAEHGGQPIKKGTWMVGVHVADDGLWAAVKDGEFNAFSVGGRGLLEDAA